MADRKHAGDGGWTAGKILGTVLLALGGAAVIALAVWVIGLSGPVREEMRSTPTPTPVWGNTMQVTPDPDAPTSEPVLRSGWQGDAVRQAQERLRALGYYSGDVDGQFGPATEAAVRLFQRTNGLDTDGRIGSETAGVLYSDAALTAPPQTQTPAPTAEPPAHTPTAAPADQPLGSGVLKSGASGEAVRNLQDRLRELGYYSGETDGAFGSGTKHAVLLFQMAKGLDADGAVGDRTRQAILSDAAVPYATPDPDAARPWVRPDGLPLIVSRTSPLADGYRTRELVTLSTYLDKSLVTAKYKDTQAEREAADALAVMLQAAHDEGITVWQISSAYRSVSGQKEIFDKKVREYMNEGSSRSRAQARTRTTVADPGTSEHHLGTCFDITVPGKTFNGTRQHKWLAAHCWEYGFILRYPEDKEKITGFTAEAWHYRWVGQPHATVMHREGLCLEEYVAKYGTDNP